MSNTMWIVTNTGTIPLPPTINRRTLRLTDPSGTVEYQRGEDYAFNFEGGLTVRAGGALRPGDVVVVRVE